VDPVGPVWLSSADESPEMSVAFFSSQIQLWGLTTIKVAESTPSKAALTSSTVLHLATLVCLLDPR
jgi:hypothetical protein